MTKKEQGQEQWQQIPFGNKNYQVSSTGKVRNIENGITLKTDTLYICLWHDGQRKSFSVRRLVAEAFVENPENHPDTYNLDGDDQNNRADNIAWCSEEASSKRSFETRYERFIQTGDKSKQLKLTRRKVRNIKKLLQEGGLSKAAIAKKYRVTRGQIQKIASGDDWADVLVPKSTVDHKEHS